MIAEVPLKWVASHNDDVLPESYPADKPIRYVEISDVNEMQGITGAADVGFGDAPSRARRILRRGDVVVSTVRTYLRAVAAVGAEHDGAIASTGFAVLRARHIDEGFLKYAVLNRAFMDQVVAQSTGVSYPAINASDLVRIRIPVPVRERQRAIADYLDRETAQIDAFIAKNEELIDLLTERRAAVIDEALVRLGGSSSVVPLKRAVDFVTVGIVVTPAKWYVDSGVPALRGLNVKPGSILTDDLVFLSDEGQRENRKSELRSGDVVVVRTGQAGAAAVVPNELDSVNAIDLLIVRTGIRVVPEFLEHFLNSDSTSRLIAHGSVGSIQGHFNVRSLRELPFPLLPVSEQRTVVRLLDEQAETIDQAIATTHRGVGLAKERRAALISAAVTGKIDVGVAA